MKLMRPLTDEEQHIVDSAIHGIGPVAEIRQAGFEQIFNQT
mgnify:CR=1 FL=1